ncbi:MAG TPA: adenylosuccinate synthetase, partial [Dehalococcoidia bacterium]|nr:adenylosuccinate synthetase [Dehalococcoidia bacterium]
RVGEGPLDGELGSEEAKRRGWDEYGTVTGRQRRAAPFNHALARRAVMINGATQLAITKFDVLHPELRGSNSYGDLSSEARKFIETVEERVGLPVTLIGTGPGFDQIIDRR